MKIEGYEGVQGTFHASRKVALVHARTVVTDLEAQLAKTQADFQNEVNISGKLGLDLEAAKHEAESLGEDLAEAQQEIAELKKANDELNLKYAAAVEAMALDQEEIKKLEARLDYTEEAAMQAADAADDVIAAALPSAEAIDRPVEE